MVKKKGATYLINAINPYNWVTDIRNRCFDCGILKSTPMNLPVICVGNITVGGTGKTPHTEYLIKMLKERHNVAVLSRGYGRKSKGYILADERSTAEQIGDEPYQMHKKFPDITVAVAEKRVSGVENLLEENKNVDVILLDDAYQHRYIKAGLNILLIDINRPIWDDFVLPFGRMRESIAGVKRADVIIITKCSAGISKERMQECEKMLSAIKKCPVFFSTFTYGELYPTFGEQRSTPTIDGNSNILLLTGIANPRPLKKELERRGAKVHLMQYPDHHNYSKRDIGDIVESFKAMEAENTFIVTTEKDASRLVEIEYLPDIIKERCFLLPIEVKIINNQNIFNQIITDYVTENSGNSRISKG